MIASIDAPNFVGGLYESPSKDVSVQRLINLDVIDAGTGGKVEKYLRSSAGESLFVASEDKCKALYTSSTSFNNEPILYAVLGGGLFAIDRAGDQYLIGNVDPNSDTIKITDNGFVGMVIDGTNAFIWDIKAPLHSIGLTFKQIKLPTNLIGSQNIDIKPINLEYLNHRFIISGEGRGEFWFSVLAVNPDSDINDIFPQLNFYSAESNGDPIEYIHQQNGRLYFFGKRSIEIWDGTGNSATDPFNRISGVANSIGLGSRWSVAGALDTVYFLGGADSGRNTVYMQQGLEPPRRVSNEGIEHAISKMANQTAYGMTVYNQGNIQYFLNFISENKTFVLNSNGSWSERLDYDWEAGKFVAWKGIKTAQAYGQIYFGSFRDGGIYQLDFNKATTADGKPLVCERTSSNLFSNRNNLIIREFLLDIDAGTQKSISNVAQVTMKMSKDGGHLWVVYPTKLVGLQGNYKRVVRWYNLGRGREITFSVRITTKEIINILGARIKAEECR